MKKIWLSSPHISDEELFYVQEAFRSNWVAPLGPNVDCFEKELAAKVGVNSVSVLNSGTAALHLALKLLAVGQGDEVICQSFTFAASAFPVLYQNAIPVFVDSENETWNISPVFLIEAIKDRIRLGKKPKAIIAVHLYGMPAKMEEINQIANEFDIPVVEDAAEALGSSINGRLCGSFGKLSVLSFNGNKIITTSGGGALCSDEEKLIQKARFLSAQSRENTPYYFHKEVGFNYRMSNVLAGIGRGQLKVLDERVESRRSNYKSYRDGLSDFEGIGFSCEPEGYFSNRWLTTVVFDEKVFGNGFNEKVRLFLEHHSIESRPLWKPLHQQPVFNQYPYYGNGVCDMLFDQGLCLPSGSNLTCENLEYVINCLKTAINETS